MAAGKPRIWLEREAGAWSRKTLGTFNKYLEHLLCVRPGGSPGSTGLTSWGPGLLSVSQQDIEQDSFKRGK